MYVCVCVCMYILCIYGFRHHGGATAPPSLNLANFTTQGKINFKNIITKTMCFRLLLQQNSGTYSGQTK